MLCQHSQFNFDSCLRFKMEQNKMSGVSRKNWPVGGEPALTKETKQLGSQPVLVHECQLCLVRLTHPCHLCFRLRKQTHGKYSSPAPKCHEFTEQQGIAYLEWDDANLNKLALRMHTQELRIRLNKTITLNKSFIKWDWNVDRCHVGTIRYPSQHH